MQTVWKGAIAFGLVSIPIRLVSATEEKDVSLRQVHVSDGGRIKYKRFCSIDGEEVPYPQIAKGYELPGGDVVILTDEDFADLPIASTKKVDVVAFAKDSEINPIALSRAYYADPTDDPKPYLLLHDTLVATGKVAVVKMALRQKERLAVIRPQDGVLVVHTMLWPDEVRNATPGFDRDTVKVRDQELQMATTYVEAFDEEFQPSDFHDEYRAALLEVVEAKSAGREVKRPVEVAEESNVVDLMEALRASIAATRGGAAGGDDAEADDAEATGSTAKASRSRVSSPKSETAASASNAGKAAPKKSASGAAKKATKTAARKASTAATKQPAKKTAAKASRRSA
jgi:DNA end-binding protein Ku